MGNIGDTISETIPAVGTSGTTYATNITAFLTEVKTRLEAQVPRTSLASGALDMETYPIQNASYLGIADGGEAPTTPTSTFQNFDGDVYWIHASGAVQITSGNSLNNALLGGITGDYGGSNPAEFKFVDADQEYYAYDDEGTGAWARVWAKNFDVAAGATSAVRVRLAYGGGSSYTLTLPTPPANPPGAAYLQMDVNGTVTASNTLAATLTANTYRFTTEEEMMIPASSAQAVNTTILHAGLNLDPNSSTGYIYYPIRLPVGTRIKSWTLYVQKASNGTKTLNAELVEITSAGFATSTIGSIKSTSAAAPGNTTLTDTTTYTTVTGKSYALRASANPAAAVGSDFFGDLKVVFDRPS